VKLTCSRIRNIDPALNYTRYIGDLSGGQIKRIAERAMNPLMGKGLLSTNDIHEKERITYRRLE